MRDSIEALAAQAAAWGLPLTESQLDQFATYLDELRAWNERLNLTAITAPDEIATRHFADSLRCALSWGATPANLIDIGAGAGFPGLPLKILQPALQLVLVESIKKKAAFLQHVVGVLGLGQVSVLAERAEVIGQDPHHREQYDAVVARAVAELRVLSEYCLPLCRVGGRFLAPKGGQASAEVAAAERAMTALGGRIIAIESVVLPGIEPRSLIVVEKIASTPPQYPRAAGVPAKRPL